MSTEIKLEREFLTADEVAKKLGVHRVTVLNWAKSGKINSLKCGRFVRFRPNVIEEFFQQEPKLQ